jgi:PE family
MSFVVTQPESLDAVAVAASGAGSATVAHNATSAAHVEVSAFKATQLVARAQMYQAVRARAVAVRQVFTTTFAIGAESYMSTETANAVIAG